MQSPSWMVPKFFQTWGSREATIKNSWLVFLMCKPEWKSDIGTFSKKFVAHHLVLLLIFWIFWWMMQRQMVCLALNQSMFRRLGWRLCLLPRAPGEFRFSDLLICEVTTLSRPDAKSNGSQDLWHWVSGFVPVYFLGEILSRWHYSKLFFTPGHFCFGVPLGSIPCFWQCLSLLIRLQPSDLVSWLSTPRSLSQPSHECHECCSWHFRDIFDASQPSPFWS